MADAVTEIAYLPLKPNLDLDSGAAKKAWEETLSTIARQPGAKSIFWGKQLEKPDVLQLAVDWESLTAHKTFQQSEAYSPFTAKLREEVLGAEPTLFHISLPPLKPGADNPLLSPVTECVAAFFSPSHPQSEYNSQFEKFKEEAAKIPDVDAKGLVGGWSVENHMYVPVVSKSEEGKDEEGKEVEGQMFAAFVGWPSVEEHMKFRQREEFHKVAPLLREGARGAEVWHVAFQQYR